MFKYNSISSDVNSSKKSLQLTTSERLDGEDDGVQNIFQ